MLSFQANNSHFYKILCAKGNEALHLCMSDQCQRPAFVCQNKGCKCRLDHKNCVFAVANSLIQKVKSKIITTREFQDKLGHYLNVMIDKLSLFSEAILEKYFSEKSKYLGLLPLERQFLQSLDELGVNKITGKKVSIICSNLKPNKQILKSFEEFKTQLYSQFQGFYANLKQFQLNVSNSLDSLTSFNSVHSIKYIPSSTTIPTNKVMSDQNIFLKQKSSEMSPLFESSKILKSQNQIQVLTSFFTKRRIKSTSLLYRASEHDFSTKRFHVECDQVPSTLVVFQTSRGKVIGGYTPLMWEIVKGEMSQEKDSTGQTFIFSLTENLKFTPIKLKQNSSIFGGMINGVGIVKYTSEFGPCFGKFELVVKDQANTEGQNAWIRFEKHNPSFDYTEIFKDPRQYYRKMLGNENPYFKITEWQVWKLKFWNQNTYQKN